MCSPFFFYLNIAFILIVGYTGFNRVKSIKNKLLIGGYMSDMKQEVIDKLKQIKEAGNVIVFPEGFEYSNESEYWWNFEIKAGVQYECSIYNDEYFAVKGNFGTNDDGYVIGELEEFTDDEILSLLLPSDEQKQKMEKLNEFEALIAKAVKDYEDFSKENKLGKSVEWSTDDATIADWNSSRC